MTTRLAIYARYSSDLQKPTSLEDQVRLCRHYIENGALGREPPLIEVYTDAALSGRTLEHRVGMQRLLQDLQRGHFTAVVTEHVDRLARELADAAQIFKCIRANGAALYTADRAEALDTLYFGITGAVSAYYLENLAEKTRRGHKGKAARGLFPAGLSYGYRVVPPHRNDRGILVTGERAIDPDQAKVVRRIFREYAAGLSIKDIAKRLNAEGVPTQRGGSWSPGSLLGSIKERRGVLHNRLYIGKLIYNRTRLKVQGRGVFLNPEKEWIVAERPDLRIVEDEVWHKVQARLEQTLAKQASGQLQGWRSEATSLTPETVSNWLVARPPPEPRGLSGLVFCGLCGAAKILSGKRRYICAQAKQAGACRNFRSSREADLFARCVAEGQARLSGSREWEPIVTLTRSEAQVARMKIEAKLKRTEAAIERLVLALEYGIQLDVATARLKVLQDRQKHLQTLLRPEREPDLTDPAGQARRVFEALAELSLQAARLHHAALWPCVVERIDCYPVYEHRSGEVIEISWNDKGWAELLRKAQALWPEGQHVPS